MMAKFLLNWEYTIKPDLGKLLLLHRHSYIFEGGRVGKDHSTYSLVSSIIHHLSIYSFNEYFLTAYHIYLTLTITEAGGTRAYNTDKISALIEHAILLG